MSAISHPFRHNLPPNPMHPGLPPYQPWNNQPWVNPYPGGPYSNPNNLPPDDEFMKAIMKSINLPKPPKPQPVGPINVEAVFTAELYTKLCQHITDSTIVNFFWVDKDFLINYFEDSDYSAGRWFDGGVYVHATSNGQVVFTTPVLQILYSRVDISMTIDQGLSNEITDDVVTKGLIPILTVMSSLLSTPTDSNTVPAKRRRKANATVMDMEKSRRYVALRSSIDSMVSDDDAMLLLDIPLVNLYDYVLTDPTHVLNLMAPAGQYITACIDPHTKALVIGCGATVLRIPHVTDNMMSNVDVDSDNLMQDEELAAILSAIYIWKEANDIKL